MKTITALTRPLSRRALTKPNLVYFLWRCVANGMRTCRAVTTRTSYSDTPMLAQEPKEQVIVVGHSDRFLTEDGRRGLNEAAARILQARRSDAVEAIVSGSVSGTERKEYLVRLVSYPHGIPPDDSLLRSRWT